MSSPALALVKSPSTAQRADSRPLADLTAPGRLIELGGQVGCARRTTAVSLLRKAQREGETTAWIQPRYGSLFPPDLVESGIDIEALVVVHVPVIVGAHGPCRAAELLLRSGAFGFVIVDLTQGVPPGAPAAWQGRLLGLARQHHCRVVLLSERESHEPSLGPLIGMRIESRAKRISSGCFRVDHTVLKNKSGAPLYPASEEYRGPWGLR